MLSTRRQQRTIATQAEVRGIGFIQGSDVTLRFLPAGADHGIVFIRTDLPGRPSVRAHIDNVVFTNRRTTIRDGEASVELVEHVMAALAAAQVDNCAIEIDAPETPGCDGSSLAFTRAIEAAGRIELDRPREVLIIDEPVTVREGSAIITAHPGTNDAYVLSYHLDYGRDNAIGAQSHFLAITPQSFATDIAPCRTFLLKAEADALRQAGIGSRTSESDILIFGPDGPIDNELRFPDECARHKLLDMVGDLALLGMDIIGHVVAHRSGHTLNSALVRELAKHAAENADRRDAVNDGQYPRIYPHSSPFPLIDTVVSHEPGKKVTALKSVSFGDPFFPRERRDTAVMPPVLLIEALAQAAVLMVAKSGKAKDGAEIAAIDSVKLYRPVHPGDQVTLEVTGRAPDASGTRVDGVATVDGAVVARAIFTFAAESADRPAA